MIANLGGNAEDVFRPKRFRMRGFFLYLLTHTKGMINYKIVRPYFIKKVSQQ